MSLPGYCIVQKNNKQISLVKSIKYLEEVNESLQPVEMSVLPVNARFIHMQNCIIALDSFSSFNTLIDYQQRTLRY
jgi:hypothetical protein